MILTLLQIAAIAGVELYLARWRAGVRRRNNQTWDSLLARLRPDWSARELSDQFLLSLIHISLAPSRSIRCPPCRLAT